MSQLTYNRNNITFFPQPPDTVVLELKSLKRLKGVKIAHLNCRSIRNKIDELKNLLSETDIDVMTFCETWLKPGDKVDSLAIPGYVITARRDGVSSPDGNRRGGVLVYVKANLAPLCTDSTHGAILDAALEVVCVDLTVHRGKKSKRGCEHRTILRVVDTYIPPGTRDQIKQLQSLEESLNHMKSMLYNCHPDGNSSKNKNIPRTKACKCEFSYVILGDFNCDMLLIGKEARSMVETKVGVLVKMQSNLHLEQLIKAPTRVQQRKEKGKDSYITTESLIDLIYTDEHANIVDSGVIHLKLSDHFMVYCCWDRSLKKDSHRAAKGSSKAKASKGATKAKTTEE